MKRVRVWICVLCALMLFAGCAGKGSTGWDEEQYREPAEELKEEPEAEATFRRSTVYYLSDEGFIVPVTKLIPWEEGIASACLSYMVSTPENLSAARELGLSTVIPEGTELSLSIRDGNALLDMKGLAPLASAEAELAMIEAVVNTLTEFSTISTVTVTRDGHSGTLENGTELPVRRSEYALNPEDPELAASTGGRQVTLYFPNLSGAVTVPVSRQMSAEPNIYSTVSALIEGSKSDKLLRCFPENTLLLGAAVENGVVTVNLSGDFARVADTKGLYSLAYRTLWLTLKEQLDFKALRMQVNGEDFAPETTEGSLDVNSFGG